MIEFSPEIFEGAKQVLGWGGAATILGEYYLVSRKVLSPTSKTYLVANLLAGSGLTAYNAFQEAWASVALNAIWAGIAAYNLVRPPK